MVKRNSEGETKVATKIHLPKESDGTLRCLKLPEDLAKDLLERKNAHIHDPYITFRERDHAYWIKGDALYIVSSTTFIHQFFSEFDAERIVGYILRSKKWSTDRSYKYYMMTKQQILDSWELNRDTAANAGTRLHADIEYHYNGLDHLVTNDSYEYRTLFQQFKDDHSEMVMYRTEQMIYSSVLKITGSIDAISKNSDGTLTLIDWKRSKKINFKAFGNKRGLEPFDHLPDCNFTHYQLQLNLYRTILETFYGEIVREMYLVVLHPDQDRYLKIIIPRMETEGHLLFEFRRQQLIEKGLLDDVEESEHYYFKTEGDLFHPDKTPIFPQLCRQ